MAVGWDDDPVVAAWRGLAPLTGDATADACVVGLGASGLAAVEALLARGLSVIGVDAGRIAAGASGRNGGFLLAGPAPGLAAAIETWSEQPAVALQRATAVELDRLAGALPAGVVRRVGSLRLAGWPGQPADDTERADTARESSALAPEAAVLRRHGVEVEEYDGALGAGLRLPADAAVNPAVRAIHTATALRSRAALHEWTPAGRVEAGRVVTPGGVVSAGVVIVAVDGRLERVLPELAGRVRTARLQMLATAPVGPRLSCPVYGHRGYDYAQQTADGRLFVGGGRDRFADEEWTPDTTPTPPIQAHLDRLAERAAGGPVRVTHRWAASVGFTDDGRPLCVEVAPGVVGVGGYSGTGNLVGPVAARAAVALALDATPPPDWASG